MRLALVSGLSQAFLEKAVLIIHLAEFRTDQALV